MLIEKARLVELFQYRSIAFVDKNRIQTWE